MRIVTFEQLKDIPRGTIISSIDGSSGYISEPMIFIGIHDHKNDYCMIKCIKLRPDYYSNDPDIIFDNMGNLITDKHFDATWVKDIYGYENYTPSFIIYSRREIEKTIEMLKDSLSGFKQDYDMETLTETEDLYNHRAPHLIVKKSGFCPLEN